MGYNRLFIFVEGSDDQRFFSGVIKPYCSDYFEDVSIIEYAGLSKQKIKAWVNSVSNMGTYIFVTDINSAKCITAKKESVLQNASRNIDIGRICVVIKEIESWYLAGISQQDRQKFGISKSGNSTDELTKEDFENLIPDNYERIDFMVELLKVFDVSQAAERNLSFNYFRAKFLSGTETE